METPNRKLDDEIQDLLGNLSNLEADSEEYSKITKNLDTLYKLKIEEEKNKSELSNVKDQNKFRIVGYILEGAGIVLPLMFYGIWMRKGFKFEETGTFTSKTFMGLQKFFKPKK